MSKVDFADDRLGGLPNRLLASDPLAAPIKVARVVACLAMVLGVAFVVVPAPVVAQASPTIANRDHGYPYPNAPDCVEATGANCVADKWNFYQGQCTSWVAYRLNQLNFKAEKDFHNHYKVHWGDASNWGAAARSVGIAVDDSPRKGDVAWWKSGFHVAYVEEVYADGSVLISEMNYDYHNAFRTTTLRRGVRWPDGFIHVKDVQSAPSDRDGDGVPDASDRCPDKAGSAENGGCPIDSEERVAAGHSVDFDGDGKTDVFWATPADGKWRVAYGGSGSWQVLNTAGVPFEQLKLGDFNGDGKTDVFWATPADGKWRVAYGGSGSWQVLNTAGVPFEQLKLGDFNGDGKTDVFWATPADGKWRVAYGGSGSWQVLNTAGVPFEQLKLGDFNGDGKTDVFWATPADGKWRVAYGGSGSWQVLNTAGVPFEQLKLGDFNGDGKTDVFWATPADGKWRVAYGGSGSWQLLNTAGVPFEQLKLGDFNGDGKTDVFWATPADGKWRVAYGGSGTWQLLNTAGVPHEQLTVGGTVPLITMTAAPTITGQAIVGDLLTLTSGTWSPSSVSTKQVWLRNGQIIPGETGATYRLVAADAGARIGARVTGSRSGLKKVEKNTAEVQVTKAGLTATPSPTVSGKPTVGQTLSAQTGEWKPAPVALVYQWLRDGSAIAGATGADYKLVAGDTGKKISVKVTGSKAGYTTVSKTSAQTAAVATAPSPKPTPSPSPSSKPTPSPSPKPSPSPSPEEPGKEFTAVSVPKVTGSVKVGKRLTADPGAWGPGEVAFSYQWYRSGAKIAKATKPTYKLVAADKGKTITVKLTGTKSGYATVSKTSVATGKVAAGSLTSVKPKITGTVKVGKKLTAKPGVWKPSSVKLSYQWLRNGKAIKGATKAVYTLASKDKGKKITVKVTGKKAGYASKSVVSKATKKVG